MTAVKMLIVVLAAGSALMAAPLPENTGRPKPAKGETWRESGTLELSYVAARSRIRAKMTAQGYKEKHCIELDQRSGRCLMLWEKDSKKIIYMLWRIDVDETGFSWGEVKDGSPK